MAINFRGIGYALLGVTIFSFTLPMVKLALPAFSPWTLTFGRATLAGLLAVGFLLMSRVGFPDRKHVIPLLVTASGIVIG